MAGVPDAAVSAIKIMAGFALGFVTHKAIVKPKVCY